MSKFSFQRTVIQTALVVLFFFCGGCSQATPEEIPDPQMNSITTHPDKFQITQIKRRPQYISPEIRTRMLIGYAAKQMRKPVPKPERIFYTIPGEENMSFSIGDTRDGYLINGQTLPMPSLLIRQLPVQYERGIVYGTPNLITLLTDTARAMEKKYPNTIMYVGNMGLKEGGDIPYSVSHNAGRDADVGFYLKDGDGKFAHPQNMYVMSRRLNAITPNGVYTFDLEKNTTLIETLLTHPKIAVQFIFVAKYLRMAIHRELIRRNASPELLARFDETVQNQAAHNDHFHIRIYCSDEDLCAGCIDRSLIHEWHEDPLPKREKCIQNHVSTLTSKKTDAQHKAAALQRLSLMGVADEHQDVILRLLNDEDPDVRSAAALGARSLNKLVSSEALVKRLAIEGNPVVRQAMFDSLATFDTEKTREAFASELYKTDITVGALETIVRFVTHNPHEIFLKPLFQAYLNADPGHDADVLIAFETVTNHLFCAEKQPECLYKLQTWIEENEKNTRQQWVIHGFRAAGYRVSNLEMHDVPVLLDALEASRPISINAQINLKRLSKLPQNSLDWSIFDVKWHYTRYFKRRSKKYNLDLSDRDERGNKL